jgi:hypothetical protein
VYYLSCPQSLRERIDEILSVKDLRTNLDNLFKYQAEAEEAPASFQADEELARRIREPETLTGEEDEDEDEDMEGVMAQFDSAGDEPNAGEESGDLNKKDEDENMGRLDSVEAVESVEQKLLSAEATVGRSIDAVGSVEVVGGAKKSLTSRTMDKMATGGSRILTKTKSTIGL